MTTKTAREGADDMQQDGAEAPAGAAAAAAAGGDAGAGNNSDGEFIEAGDIAAEFEVRRCRADPIRLQGIAVLPGLRVSIYVFSPRNGGGIAASPNLTLFQVNI